ncbi:hypothetical protein [Escherichia coli]
MMSLWDALRMNMMISYQELVRTFPKEERSNHYHIDISQKDISWGDKKFEPYITLEAEATSNDRLEVIGPASAMISDFRLKDNILTMPNGNHYNKVK